MQRLGLLLEQHLHGPLVVVHCDSPPICTQCVTSRFSLWLLGWLTLLAARARAPQLLLWLLLRLELILFSELLSGRSVAGATSQLLFRAEDVSHLRTRGLRDSTADLQFRLYVIFSRNRITLLLFSFARCGLILLYWSGPFRMHVLVHVSTLHFKSHFEHRSKLELAYLAIQDVISWSISLIDLLR